MSFFDTYVSATAAGSGNQSYFTPESADEKQISRVFYKISNSIENELSLLFTNVIDSTYADGSHSVCNRICDEWTIHSMKAACCKKPENSALAFNQLTFEGSASKLVHPGEMFNTDPFCIKAAAGEYICIETEFSGTTIPCHPESIIPSFRKSGESFVSSKDVPFLSMLGCRRTPRLRVAFWGDSITQGIGTPDDSYEHYAALISQMAGQDMAVWDIGLGYGRAHDAASDGAWMFKARQNDIVSVCFGVNDLLQKHNPEQLIDDLACIVLKLKAYGCKVLAQTVPPFNYDEETAEMWKKVNNFIRNELSGTADAVFDTVPVLSCDSAHPHLSRYGAHPNSEGHKAWAEALYPVLVKLCDETERSK